MEPFFFSFFLSFSFFDRPIEHRLMHASVRDATNFTQCVAETDTKRFHATDHYKLLCPFSLDVVDTTYSSSYFFYSFHRRRKKFSPVAHSSFILFFHPHHPFSSIEHHDIYKKMLNYMYTYTYICLCVCMYI